MTVTSANRNRPAIHHPRPAAAAAHPRPAAGTQAPRRGHPTNDTFTPHRAAKAPATAAPLPGSRVSTVAPATMSSVNANDPTLQTLANGSLRRGQAHSCVRTTLNNMNRLGVAHPSGTGADTGNNPRGAMAQLMNNNGWRSVSTPGSTTQTIRSPYGTVQAAVISGAEYNRMAAAGQIPSGAVVFQTRHDSWNDNARGSRGFDMGIARDGGRSTFNYGPTRGPNVYGNTQGVVVLVPGSAVQ